MAARAGVSFQTASKILKGSAISVAPATRERVVAAAQDLGYVPNAIARGLVTQSTFTIGIVADDLSDWSLAQFVASAERAARRRGLAVLISSVSGQAADGEAAVRALVERRVDGLIAAAPQLENDSAVAELLRGPVPVISLHHVPGGGVTLVGSDHRMSGRVVGEHLIGLGHRRIATVTGPPSRRVVSSRLHGFLAAMRDAGFEPDPALVEAADWTAEGGHSAALRLLEREADLTAIFAQNDLLAIGVISALHVRSRRVPEEVAVVGCDDLPIAAHLVPPLTSVHIPFAETGERAVDLLVDSITSGRPGPARVWLPIRLVVRGSCGAAASPQFDGGAGAPGPPS